jgi:sorbitol-specific phosphotransferase system component IIBC
MNLAIDVLLHAGRSAVDVALYTLLPIMILMMIVMRARVDECLRSVRNPKSRG